MDLVAVAGVRAALADHQDRYLRRIYTEREVDDCRRSGSIDPQRLAARFAAKEAVMKVLRPSSEQGVPWRSIAVHRHATGAPLVELRGLAADLAARQGIGEVSVSLTHEGECAAAVAIARAGDAT